MISIKSPILNIIKDCSLDFLEKNKTQLGFININDTSQIKYKYIDYDLIISKSDNLPDKYLVITINSKEIYWSIQFEFNIEDIKLINIDNSVNSKLLNIIENLIDKVLKIITNIETNKKEIKIQNNFVDIVKKLNPTNQFNFNDFSIKLLNFPISKMYLFENNLNAIGFGSQGQFGFNSIESTLSDISKDINILIKNLNIEIL